MPPTPTAPPTTPPTAPPVIVLDRGHHGKLHDDRGASHAGLVEERLSREYMAHAEDRLRDLGIRPVIQSSHPERGYRGRWLRADRYAPRVYVQCHVNAGSPTRPYGMVGFDARSSWGRRCADAIADALASVCPEAVPVRAQPCRPTDWTRRMYAVIEGVYASQTACGIVYEPGFIGAIQHAQLWTPDGLRRVGAALADGLAAYVRTAVGGSGA